MAGHKSLGQEPEPEDASEKAQIQSHEVTRLSQKLNRLWILPGVLFYGAIGCIVGGTAHFFLLVHMGKVPNAPALGEIIYWWSISGFVTGLGIFLSLLLLHAGRFDMGPQGVGGIVLASLSAGGLGAIAGVFLGGFITLFRLGIGAHLPLIMTGVVAGAMLASFMALSGFFHTARKN